jgi:hypothetical protein
MSATPEPGGAQHSDNDSDYQPDTDGGVTKSNGNAVNSESTSDDPDTHMANTDTGEKGTDKLAAQAQKATGTTKMTIGRIMTAKVIELVDNQIRAYVDSKR